MILCSIFTILCWFQQYLISTQNLSVIVIVYCEQLDAMEAYDGD